MSLPSSCTQILKPTAIERPAPDAYAVVKIGKQILLNEDMTLPRLAQCQELGAVHSAPEICGASYHDCECYGFQLDKNTAIPAALKPVSLRGFLHLCNGQERVAVVRAAELFCWQREHRCCGCCGSLMKLNPADGAMKCPECGFEAFPVLSPAVIVRITRNNGRELLLAHNRGFDGPVFSNIAGFVEAGEHFEAAIRREVREEVGVEVDNLKYFGSQNWPFPHSLIAAFTAEWVGGDITPDGEEIDQADWFDIHQPLPRLPEPGSISRELIDNALMP